MILYKEKWKGAGVVYEEKFYIYDDMRDYLVILEEAVF
jgi:hypothetical protein